jgi:hypothetical protein
VAKGKYFSSLLFAALALAPAMAHLLELPNKINLSREATSGNSPMRNRVWATQPEGLNFVVSGRMMKDTRGRLPLISDLFAALIARVSIAHF